MKKRTRMLFKISLAFMIVFAFAFQAQAGQTYKLALSLAMEGKPRIAYLGPRATYAHQAAFSKFGSQCDYLPVASIGIPRACRLRQYQSRPW